MAAHHEDEKEHLRRAENLAPDGSGHDFACVCHVVDVRVAELELTDYIASVRG